MTAAAPRRALPPLDPVLRDHVLVTLWIFVTFKQFDGDELILYPLALYFLWAFVRDFDLLFDMVARSLVLWLFPAWWMLSATWGAEPLFVLRSGLQLILTIVICYCAVLRLSGRQIMVSVLLVAGWYGILSLVADPNGGRGARGVFYSKNSLGAAMVMLWTAAICVVADPRAGRLARVASLLLALLAVRLILVSNSATAILLAAAAGAVVGGFVLTRRLTGPTLLAAIAMTGALVAFAVAWATITQTDLDVVSRVLAAFGKDATLTGRTVLWDYAAVEVARDPWLGKGAGGFWTPFDGLSTAHKIYVEFHKVPYAKFSFHNSYVEIAVHQGLIGVGIVVVATAWCVMRNVGAAVVSKTTESLFFLCMTMITLARSVTESGLMATFSLLSMLMIMGALGTLPRRVRHPHDGVAAAT